MSWIAITVNVAVGIGLIVAHARFLRRVDYLQRKILVDAMAVALGVGVIGGLAYGAPNSAGPVAVDSAIALLVAGMGVSYAVATVVGNLRYR